MSHNNEPSDVVVRLDLGLGAAADADRGTVAANVLQTTARFIAYATPAIVNGAAGLITLVVSAGHVPGPVGRAGAAASFRLRNAGPAGPCRVSLAW